MNPRFDSQSPNAFAEAIGWLQGTLLGNVATAIAVVAVASVGFLLVSGRIDVRRGAEVVCGCFVLFGASSIASGIVHALYSGDALPATAATPPPPPIYSALPPQLPSAVESAPFDPYAGAAVPPRP